MEARAAQSPQQYFAPRVGTTRVQGPSGEAVWGMKTILMSVFWKVLPPRINWCGLPLPCLLPRTMGPLFLISLLWPQFPFVTPPKSICFLIWQAGSWVINIICLFPLRRDLQFIFMSLKRKGKVPFSLFFKSELGLLDQKAWVDCWSKSQEGDLCPVRRATGLCLPEDVSIPF